MRRLAVSILYYLNIACCQGRIDLTANDQRHEIARPKLVDQRFASRSRRRRTIETHQHLTHPISCQLPASIRHGNWNLGRQHDSRTAQETVGRSATVIGSDRPEIEAAFAG